MGTHDFMQSRPFDPSDEEEWDLRLLFSLFLDFLLTTRPSASLSDGLRPTGTPCLAMPAEVSFNSGLPTGMPTGALTACIFGTIFERTVSNSGCFCKSGWRPTFLHVFGSPNQAKSMYFLASHQPCCAVGSSLGDTKQTFTAQFTRL